MISMAHWILLVVVLVIIVSYLICKGVEYVRLNNNSSSGASNSNVGRQTRNAKGNEMVLGLGEEYLRVVAAIRQADSNIQKADSKAYWIWHKANLVHEKECILRQMKV